MMVFFPKCCIFFEIWGKRWVLLFDELYLFVGQVVELVNELVDLCFEGGAFGQARGMGLVEVGLCPFAGDLLACDALRAVDGINEPEV